MTCPVYPNDLKPKKFRRRSKRVPTSLTCSLSFLDTNNLYFTDTEKDKMKPGGPVSTKYPESPENGDVKVNIPVIERLKTCGYRFYLMLI